MKKIINLLIGFAIILLIPTLAFAAAGGDCDLLNVGNCFRLNLTPPFTDISRSVLVQLFGSVGGGLETTTSTIFGQIFGLFNAGLLSIAGVGLAYTTIKAITDTAMDGGPMGQKVSYWVGIRVALGTSLLVPKATGYSIINGVVMWLVLQGVGLADLTWNRSLDYLKSGAVFIAPISEQVNVNLTRYDDDTVHASTTDFLRSIACMRTVEKVFQNRRNQDLTRFNKHYQSLESVGTFPDKGSPEYNADLAILTSAVSLQPTPMIKENFDKGIIEIPKMPVDSAGKSTGIAVMNDDGSFSNVTGLDSLCGQFKWTWDSSETNQTIKDHIERYKSLKGVALQDIINGLDDPAKNIINTRFDSSYDPAKWPDVKMKDKDKPNLTNPNDPKWETLRTYSFPNAAQQSVAMTQEYESAIYPSRQQAWQDTQPATTDPRFEQAKRDGWISAGRYFQLIYQIKKETDIDKAHYQVDTNERYLPPSKQDSGGRGDRYKFLVSFLSPYEEGCDPSKAKCPRVDDVMEWADNIGENAYYYANALNVWNTKQKTPGGLQGYRPPSLDLSQERNVLIAGAVALGLAIVNPAAIVIAGAMVLPVIGVTVPYILKLYVNHAIGDFNRLMVDDTEQRTQIAKFYEMGLSLINNALGMWKTLTAVFYTIGGIGVVAQGVLGVVAEVASFGSIFTVGEVAATSTAIQSANALMHLAEMVFMLYLPLAFAAAGTMFSTGIILAIYVPLIPFMVFMFGVIGWIIFVIEAMFASVIIALWITHPEGQHHLLGKAEHAVSLGINVFLRPVLLVIGMVGFIIVSNIVFGLFNSWFGYYATDMIPDITKAGGGLDANTVISLGVMAVYMLMSLFITERLANALIVEFSDRVSTLGFGREAVTGPHMGEMLQKLESSVSKAGQTAGEAGGGTAQKASGAAKAPQMKELSYKPKQEAKGKAGG
ncbi:MAG: DotA/TraY family protein [Gammaproteobacteria bacterium]|nr:DotA/TraY family protein [Gammaproteobacteria bacterium]